MREHLFEHLESTVVGTVSDGLHSWERVKMQTGIAAWFSAEMKYGSLASRWSKDIVLGV
jgi:hypothetical protein